MQPSDIIKSGIIYIEQNLKTDITAEELANMAGYSVWHYHRLFVQSTGMSVSAYIGKLRLNRALNEIAGGRRAIDVALEYGFDTYAGFYKAFVRMYGGSPKNYLSKSEVSVMFTEKELREILSNWDVQQDLPIIDVYTMDGTKISGNVWLVGEDYILKAGSRERMLTNMKVAKALAAQGFVASTPVLSKSGKEYLDKGQIVVLTRGIKGNPLSKPDRFGESRREFGKKYGESIARLHKALTVVESEIQPYEQNLYTHVTEWALLEVRKQNIKFNMGLPDTFFEDYINNFGILFDKLPKQLIHRDPNPSNILFDGGEVTGFIDFDLSERNVRLWDPCYCATGILSEWRGVDHIYEKWPDILEGIIRGYDNVNPLMFEEKQAIFYVICSIQMICTAYFEGVPAYKELAKQSREMLKFIWENEMHIRKVLARAVQIEGD
ncbi:helix-turn-helix domain-containing protein [Sedimentibacter sp.]|uniref:helix-turn-helix domain-containing protein n=1 Tax=Sedimentibacter sp. TaxID=1960295 RepID=UPI0028AC5A34|nr:helix-turn-helix domain-containing protein [Sedimentibacter sp.]